MKRKKILICCILAALLTIVTIIPIFAVSTNEEYFSVVPSDLGVVITSSNNIINQNVISKYYIYIPNNATSEPITLNYFTNNNTLEYQLLNIVINNNTLTLSYNSVYTEQSYTLIPNVTLEYDGTQEYYIPIFVYNCVPYKNSSGILVYSSTVTSETELMRQYYELGLTTGYNNGFDDGLLEGQNIQQYTNLVGYVEQLIGQFTGSSAAQYITPIAIVLVVLFVYFLFIRFLLSLVKAKGIIKTCDIIMIVACIIMLVVMYAPMLDLTIKTEQINSYEETTETAEVVRSSNIYKITTETGDIYYGPVGTAIVTKNETIEDIYKISEDIETEAIAYEKD